jgi:hypothetical protein
MKVVSFFSRRNGLRTTLFEKHARGQRNALELSAEHSESASNLPGESPVHRKFIRSSNIALCPFLKDKRISRVHLPPSGVSEVPQTPAPRISSPAGCPFCNRQHNFRYSADQLVEARLAEFRASAAVLGVRRVEKMSLDERRSDEEKFVRRIKDKIPRIRIGVPRGFSPLGQWT